MTYAPPPHLAVILSGKLASDRDLGFWCEAVKVQLRDHVCPAWSWRPTHVAVYSTKTWIPRREGMLIVVVDDDGNDDAAGYHNLLGGFVDLGQSDIPPRTLSHEACEMVGNANLDRWAKPLSQRIEYAMELNDAVQGDTYHIDVSIFGRKRTVPVSNFLLPAYFDETAPPPYDFMGTLREPFSIADGGYAIIKRDGVIDYLARGARAADAAKKKIAAMGADKSRTGRIAFAATKR